MASIDGWLLVYLAGSVPLVLFYAAGLSGWLFNYHLGAFAAFVLVLAAPLVLVAMKWPSAPAWNIASLWAGGGLISVRLVVAALTVDEARLKEVGVILAAIVAVSIAWALTWTMYFLMSDRVAKTFV